MSKIEEKINTDEEKNIKIFYGVCTCDKFIYINDEIPNLNKEICDFLKNKNILFYRDDDDYNAFFKTGELFGCVHGIKKEN